MRKHCEIIMESSLQAATIEETGRCEGVEADAVESRARLPMRDWVEVCAEAIGFLLRL